MHGEETVDGRDPKTAPTTPTKRVLPPLTRRAFLIAAGAGVAGVAMSGDLPDDGGGAGPMPIRSIRELMAAAAGTGPTFTQKVRRREDQLSLTFEFWNLAVTATRTGPVLTQPQDRASSFIVVVMGAQNLADQAFFETAGAVTDDKGNVQNGDEAPAPAPIDARVAGPTRVAFQIDLATLPIPYDSATLLAWQNFALSVVPNAQPVPAPSNLNQPPRAPQAVETAIEAPWKLQVSPHGQGGFAHAMAPVVHNNLTELWHTRLGTRVVGRGASINEHDDKGRTMRAIWALDQQFPTNLNGTHTPTDPVVPAPFRMSLTEGDRYDIVRLSSDFSLRNRGSQIFPLDHSFDYEPQAMSVERLMLSSLGAWLDAQVDFDMLTGPDGVVYNSSLQEWRHKAAVGRDNYVRVVRKGFLMPFGHAASLVKVTERKFARAGNNWGGTRGAYLRQRLFIVLRQHTKTFNGDFLMPFGQRKFPFRVLKATTRVTPNLDLPTPFLSGGDLTTFVVGVGGAPFPFHFVGTDWAGAESDFTIPMVWVDDTKAYGLNDAVTTPILNEYNSAARLAIRTVDLRKQKIAVALPTKPGDTQMPIATMTVNVDRPVAGSTSAQLSKKHQPAFYPSLVETTVGLPAVQAVAGKNVAAPVFEYFPTYVLSGFGLTNKAGVFFQVPAGKTPSGLNFAGDHSGGVASPNVQIRGMSKHHGPVSGNPNTAKDGVFDPSDVFKVLDAKLIGGITLKDIIALVTDSIGSPQKALKVTSEELQNPHREKTILDWHPDLKAGPPSLNLFVPNKVDGFDLKATFVTYIDQPGMSTYEVVGNLEDFTLNLFGDGAAKFLEVQVQQLTFTASSKKKADVHPKIGNVGFFGALSFVKDLAELCSFGNGSGLSINTKENGLAIELKVALPDIGFGVFDLQNIAIFAGITLPFDGSPVRFNFAFCSRQDPFILTVCMFGGGGFVGLSLGVDGVELLEFSFEFGAGIALDIGVASGSVSIMGGFYFKLETKALPNNKSEQQCTLEAFVRLNGELSILAIITLSLEFYLSLTYEGPNPEKLTGEAKMTVGVQVLFFSGHVTLKVRKEFLNSGGHSSGSFAPMGQAFLNQAATSPFTFGDTYAPADWDAYCDAFAPVGV